MMRDWTVALIVCVAVVSCNASSVIRTYGRYVAKYSCQENRR